MVANRPYGDFVSGLITSLPCTTNFQILKTISIIQSLRKDTAYIQQDLQKNRNIFEMGLALYKTLFNRIKLSRFVSL